MIQCEKLKLPLSSSGAFLRHLLRHKADTIVCTVLAPQGPEELPREEKSRQSPKVLPSL